MKYLKKYKLFENNNLKELEDEARVLCENSLAFLYDNGFDAYVTDVDDTVLIELGKYDVINDDNTSSEPLFFSWDEIKAEFIPFMEMVNEKYTIHEIVFYHDVYNEFSRDDESTIENLLDDSFDRDVIQMLQVFIKDK